MVKRDKELIQEMFYHQVRTNDAVKPDWLEGVSPLAWTLASVTESAEAINHSGWEWWKKVNPCNIDQIKWELIDIWHFELSWLAKYIHSSGGAISLDFIADSALVAHRHNVSHAKPGTTEVLNEKILDYIYSAIGRTLHKGDISYEPLRKLLVCCSDPSVGMDTATVHRMYFAKNLLNHFRQKHGYKSGTYIKTWFGEEDNEYLTKLVKSYEDLTDIEKELGIRYAEVLAHGRASEPEQS